MNHKNLKQKTKQSDNMTFGICVMREPSKNIENEESAPAYV